MADATRAAETTEKIDEKRILSVSASCVFPRAC